MQKEPPTLEELLEENIELTKETNRLIKAMRRDALIGGMVKAVIWIVLVGGSLYFSLQFLEPFLQSFSEASGGMNPKDLQLLLDLYNGT